MILTNAEIKSFYKKTHTQPFKDLSDGDGLVARWVKTGKISWYLRYRFEGKPVAFHLGHYPIMSLKQARENVRFIALC